MFKNIFALSLILIIAVFSGCSEEDDDDDNPVGPGSSSGLIVVNTGGSDEYNISVVDYVNNVAYNDLLPVNGTCILTQYGDDVYIVDKDGDRIIKFDPESRSAIGEMSTGAGSAPHNVAFVSATKAYVTMSDSAAVKIINPASMESLGSIDISSLADEDGDPDQGYAVIKNGKLYVPLRRSNGRSLTDYSSVAVIDMSADSLVTEIILQTNGTAGANICSMGGEAGRSSRVDGPLYIYSIGSVSDDSDGAIELINPDDMASQVLYTESDIGGSITTWIFDTSATGWLVSGLAERSGGQGWGLTRFDLTAGTFTAVSDFQNSYYTWAIDYSDDGLVFVGYNDEDNPGLMIFDSLNDYAPLFDDPISTGLLPKRLLCVR